MHCGVFGILTGLYPLNASSTSAQVWQLTVSPDIVKVPQENGAQGLTPYWELMHVSYAQNRVDFSSIFSFLFLSFLHGANEILYQELYFLRGGKKNCVYEWPHLRECLIWDVWYVFTALPGAPQQLYSENLNYQCKVIVWMSQWWGSSSNKCCLWRKKKYTSFSRREKKRKRKRNFKPEINWKL